ncbi:MAG: hypothetical protein JKY94_17555 [Rhodobacteraceae bacterium]|nr:hypothetical protein [Paracoccaceae bacterium]
MVSRKFCVLYLGARARLFAHLPDWGSKPPTLRWAYPADIFESDGLEEQRVTALTAPDLSSPTDTDCVHFLSAVFKEDGRLSSTSLWSALYSIAHRRLALPFYFEALYAAVDAVDAADVQIVNFNLSDLLYESGEILRIDKRSGAFETRVVQVVDRGSNIITVDASWEASIPPTSAAFYFVLYAVLDAPPSRKWLSDLEQHVTLKFRSVK